MTTRRGLAGPLFLVALTMLTDCSGPDAGGAAGPGVSPGNGKVEPAPAMAPGERLVVLSDLYGVCVSPDRRMMGTTVRIYDASYGKLDINRDGGKIEIGFMANATPEGPFELEVGKGRMSQAGYHWLEFGWLGNGSQRFVWAYSLGEDPRRNVMVTYPGGDAEAAAVAERLADALVPCEARIDGPKPKPLDPKHRPFARD